MIILRTGPIKAGLAVELVDVEVPLDPGLAHRSTEVEV